MEEVVVDKPVEITVTAEEQEQVFKGQRPERMNFDVYRKVRSDLKKATKLYLGGKIIFKSKRLFLKSEIAKIKERDGIDPSDIKGKTYIRTTPKSHHISQKHQMEQ